MTMLLLRKYWPAVVLAVAAIFATTIAYRKGVASGKAQIQARWDKDIKEREAAQRVEKERLEKRYEKQITDAIAARDEKLQQVQADADNARAAASSMRQQLAAGRGRITTSTPAAVADYAHALMDILGECTDRYTEMARAADGHAADAAALMQAWPKGGQ